MLCHFGQFRVLVQPIAKKTLVSSYLYFNKGDFSLYIQTMTNIFFFFMQMLIDHHNEFLEINKIKNKKKRKIICKLLTPLPQSKLIEI